ncbi:heme-binding protein [Intestinibacillus massiliensis]|uniref:heme-binding protein n=1 Tax=Intestinibacillus massiliensis TaxID=1871029 RepID=UPI000B34E025|nr:heme-binding protein [Intestinibacillus massiliensis]
MNDSATLLQACERQEALYQFDRFTREDALKLGLKLHENALKYPQGVAVEITVNGLSVFRYVPEGACLNNIKWLERKARTVTQFEMSSLRTMAQLEVNGEDYVAQKLNPNDYALGGGGFPLTVRGVGVVGVIAVSGLPHLDDHQLIVDTLAEFIAEK